MKRHIITMAACAICMAFASAQLPYQNPALSPEERAEDLLLRLSLEEKVTLMQNNSYGVERLGIKPYEWWNEALHGVGRNGLATVFPQTIGMAASWNSELLEKVFTAVSDEARVKHRQAVEKGKSERYQGLTFWTPNINIFRDPRWGRGQETYGEDPYLTGVLGLAVVRGLQGPTDSKYDKAHACAKHFAVHSGPEWNRHTYNADLTDPRDLYETYLPAFKDLVTKGNVKEVMCAYNRYEGNPCCGSNRLLVQILRNEWDYQGIVVSDCGAIDDFYAPRRHETSMDAAEASATAVLSGTDLECGVSYRQLVLAVQRGQIKESDIDVSVKRLLKARFELGEMDERTPWDDIPDATLNSKAHQQLALDMAHQTMVLLQNKNNILPLKKNLKVAVIGANANDSVMQWGNYNGTPASTATLLKALQQRLPKSKLIYVPACDLTSDRVFSSLFNQCYNKSGKGFEVLYWDNKDFQGDPIIKGRETTPWAKYTQGNTAFAAGVPLHDFSCTYKSTFHANNNKDVEFRIGALGTITLIINGKQVLKQVGNINDLTPVYVLKAEAGKDYDIELRYQYQTYAGKLSFDIGLNEVFNPQDILAKVAKADVVIYAGGISPRLEGEEMPVSIEGFKGGDRTDIELPAIQRNLLKVLKEGGKKIIYVNFSGSAIAMVPETESCDAIIQAWYPGQAGGTAIADVIYGDYNPSGKLPVTFYRNLAQIPDFEDYSMKGRTYRYMQESPLFQFGYGLSYTTFKFGEPRIEGSNVVVSVTNTGKMNGDEVVQLYVKNNNDNSGPLKTLRGFKRVTIPAGQTVNVSIPLTEETFNWWDKKIHTVHPMKGSYTLLIGNSSDDKDLQTITYNF
ncbi:MAG: glycoside hydrolase family 3 C-terminal domain-containing protein [Bacteroidaceae bacterium]|nr:glycoside hydrolase family 3 C-terminal domain-containing protein [Bacteroidaceae bacterium]